MVPQPTTRVVARGHTVPAIAVQVLLGAAGLLCGPSVVAQEEAETGPRHRHEVSLLIAHTHVSQGVDIDGGRTWLALPCWGLNYNYWLSSHWAIGLHTDLINEVFKVEENLHNGGQEPVLERSRPVAPAIMATFRPHEHWSFVLGAGEEFAKEQDLFLIRAGTEYTIHLAGPWETSGSLAYDARFNAYDSWTLGLGVTRLFR